MSLPSKARLRQGAFPLDPTEPCYWLLITCIIFLNHVSKRCFYFCFYYKTMTSMRRGTFWIILLVDCRYSTFYFENTWWLKFCWSNVLVNEWMDEWLMFFLWLFFVFFGGVWGWPYPCGYLTLPSKGLFLEVTYYNMWHHRFCVHIAWVHILSFLVTIIY